MKVDCILLLRRMAVVLTGVFLISGTAIVACGAGRSVSATLRPNKSLGLGFDEIDEPTDLEVVLNAPADYLIDHSDFRDSAGTVWAGTDILRHYVTKDNWGRRKTHTYRVTGVRSNEVHSVGFTGQLVREVVATVPGSVPFDAALADLDIDVDSLGQCSDGMTGHWPPSNSDMEDEHEKGEGGGLQIPANMYPYASWPATLGEDYKYLRVTRLRPCWVGHPDGTPLPKIPGTDEDYVGTLKFEYDLPGLAIYHIGGERIPSGQVIYVPPGGFSNKDFGLLTNTNFGAASGTIKATFTWYTSGDEKNIKEQGDAVDVVRVAPLAPFVVSSVFYECASGHQADNVCRDNGTLYRLGNAWHWQAGRWEQYPTSYRRDSKIQLDVAFMTSCLHYNEEVTFRGESAFTGEGNQNLHFDPRTATVAPPSPPPSPPASPRAYATVLDWVCAHKLKNVIDYADPLAINWYYQESGGVEWWNAGTSANQVYVTLEQPAASQLFHTLLDIGCRNAVNQDTPAGAIPLIWGEFTDLCVRRISDGKQMKYWGTWASNTTPSVDVFATAGLLRNADGRCGAWAYLLDDTYRTQGITGQSHKGIKVKNLPGLTGMEILVKNWDTSALPSETCPRDLPGVAAQDNSDPRAIFPNHGVVVFGDGKIQDPSYGRAFDSLLLWEQGSLDAFRYNDTTIWRTTYRVNSSAQETEFEP